MRPRGRSQRHLRKFIHRFRAVEEGAAVRGREVSQLSLEEMTALWNEAKRS